MNPRQDIPLLSAIASPVFGFSADDLASIRSEYKHGSMYDALINSNHLKVKSFLEILNILRNDAKMKSLTGLIESCFQLTRIDSIYGAMPGGDAKKANLQLFFQLACDFEKNSIRDVSQFLEHLSALQDRGLAGAGTSTSSAVTIMSIHKSKGLEFPVVFLCGLARAFNRESQQAQVLCDKELGVGLSVADTKNRIRYPSIAKRAISMKMASESLSEEMRVLYVAMTRARDRLIMVYSAKNPEADLSDIALRLDFDRGQLLCADAICPGDWVLLEAMQHMEAGALHAVGGRPGELRLGKYPWNIQLGKASDVDSTATISDLEEVSISEEAEHKLRLELNYMYPHYAATITPSKQTATDRKGRIKDAEAAENTQERKHPVRKWRRASFLSQQIEGKDYGNAIHAAMQFIRYEACVDVESVRQEVNRMVTQAFLTQEQAGLVDCEKIAAFFRTEIGVKLYQSVPCVREFKFSILDDAQKYGDGLIGEQVLLQGVVDCAILEPDGITILDFKTDYATEENLPNLILRYQDQLNAYADAMERIYQMPVKRKCLYFFRLNRFVEI